jgi:hypothetical protein
MPIYVSCTSPWMFGNDHTSVAADPRFVTTRARECPIGRITQLRVHVTPSHRTVQRAGDDPILRIPHI